MTLHAQLIAAASKAPNLLGGSGELVRAFLRQQQCPDGGFPNRAGQSDLYYTVFALDAALALGRHGRSGAAQAPLPASDWLHPMLTRAVEFLRQYGSGRDFDLVHRCCLARAWSVARETIGADLPPPAQEELYNSLQDFRCATGGYRTEPTSALGSVYGAYLVLGACQDLQRDVPDVPGILASFAALQTADGAWANAVANPVHPQAGTGSTNATAAAITVMSCLGQPVPAGAIDWLCARRHPKGGFVAAPPVAVPDLLSTATALHALCAAGAELGPHRETCLDFVDSLWCNQGGFYGHWADDTLDCEYAWYGLLTLGLLGP